MTQPEPTKNGHQRHIERGQKTGIGRGGAHQANLLHGRPQQQQTAQADRDREAFESKYGFRVDAYEYGAMARDLNFRR